MNHIAHRTAATLTTDVSPAVTLAAYVSPAATLAGLVWPANARAHDGHGATDAHWHATDTWGLLVFGGMLALALWLGRRHK